MHAVPVVRETVSIGVPVAVDRVGHPKSCGCHILLRCSRFATTDPETATLERFADELDLAQCRIDQVTELAIAAIRARTSRAPGRETCLDCGCEIPAKRLMHVPNATRCTRCQERHERLQ